MNNARVSGSSPRHKRRCILRYEVPHGNLTRGWVSLVPVAHLQVASNSIKYAKHLYLIAAQY